MSNRRDAGDKVRHGWSVASVARVSHNDESPDAAMRQRVLDAALAELATTNAGSFTMAAVASRAGLEVQVVKDMWPNTPELISAALMAFAGRNMPVPDTGSLREDLMGYSKAFAVAVNSPTGRRLLDAVIATPKDWDVSGWRYSFFLARRQRVAPLFQRAIERGDCPPDIDPARIIDLLTAGLCIPLQFYDRPITDEDCEAVVDVLLNGIRRIR